MIELIEHIFESVIRVKLFTILRTFLEEDELDIIKVLTENVIVSTHWKRNSRRYRVTDTGVPQGDCLSSLLVILKRARALKPTRTTDNEHNYSMARHDTITTEEETSITEQYHCYRLPSQKQKLK